jgi:cyanophycin synthetase
MNTSIALKSSQLLRSYGSDRNGSAEPKSKRNLAPVRPSRERPPVITVTGTNGKTTVTRMVAHVAEYMGLPFEITAERCGAALSVLKGPSSAVARGESAQGEIDVAVLMDAGVDPLARDTLEGAIDLRRVASMIADRVHDGATLILNADDPYLCQALDCMGAATTPRRVAYFSVDLRCPAIRAHREAGGLAYLLRDGWLVEASGASERRVVRVTDLAVTLGGTARFQITNALAAIAAARAVGFGVAEILCALRTFESASHNVGRCDLYKVKSGYVLLDHARTPAALEALSEAVAQWQARRVTGVLSVGGDLRDHSIEMSGKVAAWRFDRLFLKEDRDRRGRALGEAARLMQHAIFEELPDYPCALVLDEEEAITRAIAEMVPDEVVVVVSDNPERVRGILARYAAHSAHTFERQDDAVVSSAA